MKTVLYVDDEQLNLLIFRGNFQTEFNVLVAENGELGLRVLKENESIVAVISDMKMPKMNGIEFIKNVKGHKPELPCFLLSGYDLTPEISEAKKNKLVVDFFQKPIDIPKVKKAIDDLLD